MFIISVFAASVLAFSPVAFGQKAAPSSTGKISLPKPEAFENLVKNFVAARALETNAPDKACVAYEKIKKSGHASLARLAGVRRSVVCPARESYEPEGGELSWLIDWVKESTDALLAAKNESAEARLSAYLLRARLDDEQEERLDAIERGLKLAANESKGEKKAEWLERFEKQKIRVAPRFTPDPVPPSEFGAIIDDYNKVREYDKARAWLEKNSKRGDLKTDDIYRLKAAIAQSFKREQKKKANLQSLQELFTWAEKATAKARSPKEEALPNALFHDALTLYTRALWTNGNREGGARILKKYYPRFAKEEAAEIAWILARMEEEARDYESSNLWAMKSAQQADADGALREKSLFLAAWNLKKTGADAGAIEAFEKLTQLPRRPHELAKYYFWLGWLHEKRKSRAKAEEYFTKTAEVDPFGYYGILSYIHREKNFPPLKLQPLKEQEDARDEMTVTLAALGEKELLKKYLGHLIAQWDAKTEMNVKYAQARALADVGSHLPLFTLFSALDAADRWEFFRAHSEAVFPRKFTPIIDKAARDRGLPSELLFSIIRQESTYDPEARSWADAMGLMQVLATMGDGLARRAGVKYSEHQDLFKPEVNIPIGSLLMSDLYKKMGGNILLTAASYNANPTSVNKWIRARSKQSFIEFIEEIPYEETRTYMKLVLRNFVFYRRLQSPEAEIGAPQECLESLQFPRKSTPKRKKK